MDYPVWDVTIGGGMLMALVAIPHVIVAHFAIGGGLLLAVMETLSVKRGDGELRELAKRSSLILILVSTVFGAISGVGIWVVAGLIAPGAISALIHTYVWGWAIEWVFFIVEIVAALIYYTTWDRISKSAHLMLAWLYFVAAYLSLVIINGIITFMLTPGDWLVTGAFWDGFFNPTYWPSLVLRTGICLMMATGFLLFAACRSTPTERPRLVRFLGWWMVAGILVAYAGYRWWEAALPDTVRAMFAPGSALINGLDATRSLSLWALAGALALTLVFLIALPRWAKLPVVVLVAALAMLHFGSYERLREGVRKPFLIHSHMFSNGLRIDAIESFNERGMNEVSGWVAAAPDEMGRGERIFRAQCFACHTIDGYLAMRQALPTTAEVRAVSADSPPGSGAAVYTTECAPCHADFSAEEMRQMLPTVAEIEDDPEMINELNAGMVYATLERMHELGDRYTQLAAGELAATAEYEIPHMPPFVGSQEDMAALSEYLRTLQGDGASVQGGVQ